MYRTLRCNSRRCTRSSLSPFHSLTTSILAPLCLCPAPQVHLDGGVAHQHQRDHRDLLGAGGSAGRGMGLLLHGDQLGVDRRIDVQVEHGREHPAPDLSFGDVPGRRVRGSYRLILFTTVFTPRSDFFASNPCRIAFATAGLFMGLVERSRGDHGTFLLLFRFRRGLLASPHECGCSIFFNSPLVLSCVELSRNRCNVYRLIGERRRLRTKWKCGNGKNRAVCMESEAVALLVDLAVNPSSDTFGAFAL